MNDEEEHSTKTQRDEKSSYENYAVAPRFDLFFSFINGLLRKGSICPLKQSDLGSLPDEIEPLKCYERFKSEFDAQVCLFPNEDDWDKRSMYSSIMGIVGFYNLFLILVGSFVSFLSVFAVPLLQEVIVKSQNGDHPVDDEILGVFILLTLLIPSVSALSQAHTTSLQNYCCLQMESSLKIACHAKVLNMGTLAQRQHSLGDITNMFSRDIRIACNFVNIFPSVLLLPIQLILGLSLVYNIMGNSALFSIVVVAINLPCNFYFSKISLFHFREYRKESASGMKMKSEIFTTIRGMKYFSWEEPFSRCVRALRSIELAKLMKYQLWQLPTILLSILVPVAMPLIVFYVYAKEGNQMTYIQAFTTLMIFDRIITSLTDLPSLLNLCVESTASMSIIKRFLCAPDVQKYLTIIDESFSIDNKNNNIAIRFDRASLGWFPPGDLEKQVNQYRVPTSKDKSSANRDHITKYANLLDKGNYISDENVEKIDRSVHTLKKISLDIMKGELVAVVGPVGCGKSSILCAILGELSLHQNDYENGGHIYSSFPIGSSVTNMTDKYKSGKIAYTEQQPWIYNATLTENILFGLPYEHNKFSKVLELAALGPDLVTLPSGADTEIGERGINLSGGQKARVSLARALYRSYNYIGEDKSNIHRQAELFLLDDPLSAVDAHTAGHLFHKAIREFLCIEQGGTVVLVTHQVQFLRHVDKIVVLGEQGVIQDVGSHAELLSRSAHLIPKDNDPLFNTLENIDSIDIIDPHISSRTIILEKVSTDKNNDCRKKQMQVIQQEKKSLTTKEGRSKGAVATATYIFYIKSGGAHYFIILILFLIARVCFAITANFVIANWGKAQESASDNTENVKSGLTTDENLDFVASYAVYSLLEAAAVFAVGILKIFFSQTGAWRNHENLVSTFLSAPISYYDSTPLGRILNLFSNDLRSMTAMLAGAFIRTMESWLKAVGGVIVICIATQGWAVCVLVPLGILYYHLQVYFRKTNTELARIVAIRTSPIIVEFTSTLNSLISLRAYNAQELCLYNMSRKVDSLNTTQRVKQMVSLWLNLRLEILGASVAFLCILIQVLSRGIISPDALSLAVLYAQALPKLCENFLRVSAFLEATMSSCERVKNAISYTPQENYISVRSYVPNSEVSDSIDDVNAIKSPVPIQTIIPPLEWPKHGNIEVRNLSMRYKAGSHCKDKKQKRKKEPEKCKTLSEKLDGKKNNININPMILKNLNFTVNSSEKIGIVGRTGSGKSSLMVALFQIEDCEEGSEIIIDGIDIRCVPLEILRGRLGIILQESFMFSETLRFNIDPFHKFSDQQIWEVLDVVNMKVSVQAMNGGLDSHVAEGGSNLSHGQRQLCCFARALLCKSKILVLDEATAYVDNDTDAKIQELLREKFSTSTILVIAHRLHTIRKSDKILVMEQGNVGEYDTPDNLLEKENGIFKSLWMQYEESRKT